MEASRGNKPSIGCYAKREAIELKVGKYSDRSRQRLDIDILHEQEESLSVVSQNLYDVTKVETHIDCIVIRL